MAGENEGKYVRGYLYQVSPPPPTASPAGYEGYEQRLHLSTAIMQKVQILLLCVIRVWHPGALRGGGGVAHLTESPD